MGKDSEPSYLTGTNRESGKSVSDLSYVFTTRGLQRIIRKCVFSFPTPGCWVEPSVFGRECLSISPG